MHRAKPRTIQNTSENRPSQKRSTAYNRNWPIQSTKGKTLWTKSFLRCRKKNSRRLSMQNTGCFPEIPTKYILTYFLIKNGSHHFNTYKGCNFKLFLVFKFYKTNKNEKEPPARIKNVSWWHFLLPIFNFQGSQRSLVLPSVFDCWKKSQKLTPLFEKNKLPCLSCVKVR